jgi:hypothetical protein
MNINTGYICPTLEYAAAHGPRPSLMTRSIFRREHACRIILGGYSSYTEALLTLSLPRLLEKEDTALQTSLSASSTLHSETIYP